MQNQDIYIDVFIRMKNSCARNTMGCNKCSYIELCSEITGAPSSFNNNKIQKEIEKHFGETNNQKTYQRKR